MRGVIRESLQGLCVTVLAFQAPLLIGGACSKLITPYRFVFPMPKRDSKGGLETPTRATQPQTLRHLQHRTPRPPPILPSQKATAPKKPCFHPKESRQGQPGSGLPALRGRPRGRAPALFQTPQVTSQTPNRPNLNSNCQARTRKLSAELANGRLAMMAIIGTLAQSARRVSSLGLSGKCVTASLS